MQKKIIVPVAVSLIFSLAYAGANKAWNGTYTTLKGKYLIYSNDLDEMEAPTQNDRRVSFMVEGIVARDLFESIGPDLKGACGASATVYVRQKGDVECTYDKSNHSEPYTCHFGFNLKTGKSIFGSTC